MKNALILLAGGNGKRLRSKEPKQFIKINNENIIEYFLKNLNKSLFDIIIISASLKDRNKYLKSIQIDFNQHRIEFAKNGNTRQKSVKNSLEKLRANNPKNVLIHDSARPLASNKIFKKIINNLKKNISAIPYIFNSDYQKSTKALIIKKNEILNIQTPQGFDYKKIYKCHQNVNNENYKDDSSIFEAHGLKLKMIKGEVSNFKITHNEDLELYKKIKKTEQRSGIGYDIHKIDFTKKNGLTLCGVKIKHPPLIGHSDADVGYHAVCDSILGSLSMKDIGYHFNNNNLRWKNANSKIFIIFCNQLLIEKGYKIINLDINFICESPNIRIEYRNTNDY